MSNYTILASDHRSDGTIYQAFVDNLAGFDSFVADSWPGILPGSTVDIADLKTVMRLRNDGTWEVLRYYGEPTVDGATPEQAIVEATLDDLIPDDMIEEV